MGSLSLTLTTPGCWTWLGLTLLLLTSYAASLWGKFRLFTAVGLFNPSFLYSCINRNDKIFIEKDVAHALIFWAYGRGVGLVAIVTRTSKKQNVCRSGIFGVSVAMSRSSVREPLFLSVSKKTPLTVHIRPTATRSTTKQVLAIAVNLRRRL